MENTKKIISNIKHFKIFPETQTYLINWLGGTSGAFLATLFYNILFPSNLTKVAGFNYGDAHAGLDSVLNSHYLYNDSFDGDANNLYQKVFPKNESEPFIIIDHMVPNLSYFFNKFPIGKVVRITIDKNMIPRLLVNFFYKTIVQHDYNKSEHLGWNNIQKHFDYFKEFKTPINLPNFLVKKYINESLEFYEIDEYYSENFKIPLNYQNNIFSIKFYDIIHNKEKILQTIQEITCKTFNFNFINNQYDDYLNKQNRLLSDFAPWINDK